MENSHFQDHLDNLEKLQRNVCHDQIIIGMVDHELVAARIQVSPYPHRSDYPFGTIIGFYTYRWMPKETTVTNDNYWVDADFLTVVELDVGDRKLRLEAGMMHYRLPEHPVLTPIEVERALGG